MTVPDWMPKTVRELKPVKGIEEYARSRYEDVFIFYKRKGLYAECLCSECGGRYEIRTHTTGDPFQDDAARIEKPERDAATKCRLCNRKALYATAGRFQSRWSSLHILVGEKISDTRFVFRIFSTFQKIVQNQEAYYSCTEVKRIFTEQGKKAVRYTQSYLHHEWMQTNAGDTYSYIAHPKTFREIKKTGMYKYVPVPEYFKAMYNRDSWIMDFYIAAARYPDMEMILKLGMSKLADGLINQKGVNFNPRGREIHDRLRINKNRLPALVESQGAARELKIYQIERRCKRTFTDEELEIVTSLYNDLFTNDFEKALKYMSPLKLKNYFAKQGIWYAKYDKFGAKRREYFDYLSMREKCGYDMTNEIYLFPKDITRRHDEMVLETEQKVLDERKKEVMEKFKAIGKKYRKLSDTYSAAAAGYIIRPAKDAAEIVTEGRILHHCVGASDTYLMSHNTGRSFILFLRKAEEPDMPYITVEIKGEKIIQWYGKYDSKPNKEYINSWLNKYTSELTKRKEKKTKTSKTA